MSHWAPAGSVTISCGKHFGCCGRGCDACLVVAGLQGKHEDALQLLATPAAAAALPMAAELREAQAAVLQLAGKAPEAAELYRAILADQPDDWNAALLYLDCKVPGGTPGINYSSCMAVARELLGPGRPWEAPVSEGEWVWGWVCGWFPDPCSKAYGVGTCLLY